MKAYRPPFQKSAAEAVFGLDLSAWTQDEISDFMSVPVPELEAAVLPPGIRTARHPFTDEEKELFLRIDGSDMLSPELTCNAVLTDETRMRQFQLTAEDAVREGAASGYSSFLLDGAWDRLFAGNEYPYQWERLLRKLIPVLEETGIQLLLPVSVPVSSPETDAKMKKFLNRTGAPRIKVRLNVRFPAPGKPFPKPAECPFLLQETASVHFLVDTGDGMEPDPAPFGEWIGALAVYGFKGPYYFTFTGAASRDTAAMQSRAADWVRRLRTVPENKAG